MRELALEIVGVGVYSGKWMLGYRVAGVCDWYERSRSLYQLVPSSIGVVRAVSYGILGGSRAIGDGRKSGGKEHVSFLVDRSRNERGKIKEKLQTPEELE